MIVPEEGRKTNNSSINIKDKFINRWTNDSDSWYHTNWQTIDIMNINHSFEQKCSRYLRIYGFSLQISYPTQRFNIGCAPISVILYTSYNPQSDKCELESWRFFLHINDMRFELVVLYILSAPFILLHHF